MGERSQKIYFSSVSAHRAAGLQACCEPSAAVPTVSLASTGRGGVWGKGVLSQYHRRNLERDVHVGLLPSPDSSP